MEDDFHQFDPYEYLIKVSNLLNEIAVHHNKLADEVLRQKAVISRLQRAVIDLEKRSQ